MRLALLIILLLPSCQALRDSIQSARINQNLDDTDRLLEHYANKAK